jgi:hypothetical protein
LRIEEKGCPVLKKMCVLPVLFRDRSLKLKLNRSVKLDSTPAGRLPIQEANGSDIIRKNFPPLAAINGFQVLKLEDSASVIHEASGPAT